MKTFLSSSLISVLGNTRPSINSQQFQFTIRWKHEHTTENDPVDLFSVQQVYAVFVIEHAGQELDSYVPESFNEAKSILGQVIRAEFW